MTAQCKTDTQLLDLIYQTSPGNSDVTDQSNPPNEANTIQTETTEVTARPDCETNAMTAKENDSNDHNELRNTTNACDTDRSEVSIQNKVQSDDITEDPIRETIPEGSYINYNVNANADTTDTKLASTHTEQTDTNKSDINEILAVKYRSQDEEKEELISLTREELEAELKSCRQEVISLKKQLAKSERQVKKSDDYNEVLRSMLENVSSQVHSYKTATFSEAAIQVDKNDLLNYTTGELCMPDWGTDPVCGSDSVTMDTETVQSVEDQRHTLGSDEAPMSLADSIKMAAQEVLDNQTKDTMLMQGYVYDEAYGLYYHSESGYYYDSEKQLYYDPNTGIYYYYDYDTGQYAFYSQVNTFEGDAFTAYRETPANKKQGNLPKLGKKPKRIKKKVTPEEGFKNRRERRQAMRDKKEQARNKRLERRKERKIKDKNRLDLEHSKSGEKNKEISLSRKVDKERSISGEKKNEKSISRSSSSTGSDKGYSERSIGDRNGRKKRKYRDGEDEQKENSDVDDLEHSAKRHKHKKKKHKKEKHKKSAKKSKHKKKKHKKKREEVDSDYNDKDKKADHVGKELENPEVQTVQPGDNDVEKKIDNQTFEPQGVVSGTEGNIVECNDTENQGEIELQIGTHTDIGGRDTADTNKGILNDAMESVKDKTNTSVNYQPVTIDSTISDSTNHSVKHESSDSNASYNSEKELSEASQSTEESGEITDSTSSVESEWDSGEDSDDVSDDSSDDSSDSDPQDDVYIIHDFEEYDGTGEQGIAQSWPPCVRVIVTESDFVAVGMLYIVTYQGAMIGRGKGNAICIPDINISKCHAEIKFNDRDRMFTITDKSSQNGTFLNEERISKPKEESVPRSFKHGDVLQIADTKLLCHIHNGTDTCDECEPGIVMAKYRKQQPKHEVKFVSKEERLKMQRKELNEIKKRYGLKNAAFENHSEVLNNPNYEDKAAERRKTVRSDVSSTVTKEVPASVFRPISSENKGHKMLAKMGWKEGESLGKDNSGIQEPIAVSLRVNQSAGLGSASAGLFSADDANSMDVRKADRRIRAMQRYDQLQKTEQLAHQKSEKTVEKVEESSSAVKQLPEKYKMSWSKGDTEYT